MKHVKLEKRKSLMKLVNAIKHSVKKEDSFIDLCEEYNINAEVLDVVPMIFADIDVSAKTDRGMIVLNLGLLKKTKEEIKSYVYHEFVHYIQQCYGKKPTNSEQNNSYLDNPYEIEAFQNQVKYLDDALGPHAADKYIDKLLDHHDIEDKSERKEKEDVLTALIE